MELSSRDKVPRGEGVTPYNVLYREALPKRGTFF